MDFHEFIGIQKNAISKQKCDDIIQFFGENKNLQQYGYVSNSHSFEISDKVRIDFSVKKSLDICRKFSLEQLPENIILECIQKYTPVYERKFNSLKKIEKWQLCDNYNLCKYEPNMGYFAEHCEMHGNKVDGDRLIAWMIYLNDVSDGGETYFRYQDIKITPEVGSFLIWPAYWTHPHNGIISHTQNKYIATGWFTFL